MDSKSIKDENDRSEVQAALYDAEKAERQKAFRDYLNAIPAMPPAVTTGNLISSHLPVFAGLPYASYGVKDYGQSTISKIRSYLKEAFPEKVIEITSNEGYVIASCVEYAEGKWSFSAEMGDLTKDHIQEIMAMIKMQGK